MQRPAVVNRILYYTDMQYYIHYVFHFLNKLMIDFFVEMIKFHRDSMSVIFLFSILLSQAHTGYPKKLVKTMFL